MTAGRVSGLFRALSLALIIPGLSGCLAGPGPAQRHDRLGTVPRRAG